MCGRRFGKTYLGAEEIRRAYRLAVENNIHPDNEIWYGAPTFNQAKRVMWNRLKRNIPEDWVRGRPNNTECVTPMKTGHVIRVVGLDDPDALRGSGLWFFLGDEWDDAKPVILPRDHPVHARHLQRARHVYRHAQGLAALYKGYRQGQPGFLQPDDPLYQEVLLGRLPDHKSWKYNTLEGGNVPQEEIDNALRSFDARTFRQEYLASFETLRAAYDFDRAERVRRCDSHHDLKLAAALRLAAYAAAIRIGPAISR